MQHILVDTRSPESTVKTSPLGDAIVTQDE
jgi:hypothetical protein